MIKRGAEVVIRMLANVQQTTIEPLIKATIALILRSTQMSMPSTILCLSGAIDIKRSVMVRENMLAMTMAMASVKSMSIQWKAFGRSCAPGYVHIAEFLRKGCRYTWAFLSLSIMLKNEAKPC